MALIGNIQLISDFLEKFSQLGLSGFRINRICLIGGSSIDKTILPESVTIYKSIQDLLENPEFDTLAFNSSQGELSDEEIQQILQLKFQGVSVYDFPSFYENITGKIPLDYVDCNWLLSDSGFQGKVSTYYLKVKKLIDIFFSTILLIVTFPLCVLLAIAIKLESKGKVFF
ncbi:unnamed protein product, partial [marine sediment metagenome]